MSDLERHADELRGRGYAVVPAVLDPGELAATRAALEEVFAREAGFAEARGWKNRSWRVAYMLPQKHALFRALALNPRVLALMRAVLGEDCIINSFNGLTMVAGGEPQRLHRDSNALPGHVLYINALHALDDFTVANGCTRLIPGSQNRRVAKRKHDIHYDPSDPLEAEAIHVEAPAGSMIAYDGGLWHAGSRNTTDLPRRALHLFYCRPWVRPQWDFARSLSPEVIATMTPAERAIFGLHLRQGWYDWRTDQRRDD